jgi:hypothetical protein
LFGNELIKVGVGVVPARAFAAVADHDIFQIALSGVAIERLDRAIELGGRLRCSQQAAWDAGPVGLGQRRCGEERIDLKAQGIAIVPPAFEPARVERLCARVNLGHGRSYQRSLIKLRCRYHDGTGATLNPSQLTGLSTCRVSGSKIIVLIALYT